MLSINSFLTKYAYTPKTREASIRILDDFTNNFAPENGVKLVGTVPNTADVGSDWMDKHIWNNVQTYMATCIYIHNYLDKRAEELAHMFDVELSIILQNYKDANKIDWTDIKHQHIDRYKYTLDLPMSVKQIYLHLALAL